ncbi:MAG TPA: histidine decarboxylase [Archangium sp.]|nr:histidine decarboxylase [Archangium sp.]
MYNRELNESEKTRLRAIEAKIKHNSMLYAGYTPNTVFDYSELFPLLKYSFNNIGDPFFGNNPGGTHEFEREVLGFFAKLLHAPETFVGYVCNGGTEGNLYGLYAARCRYPDGVVYYSSHSHYSIPKNLDILRMEGREIAALENGELDYGELSRALRDGGARPAIVVVNVGTTVTGAIDDVDRIKWSLAEASVSEYFLHADAAFNGMVLPFVEDPQPFCFRSGIHSIAISGHKFIGSPFPSGVALLRENFFDAGSKMVDYISKPDTTLSGSRNGISPLFLWYAIKRQGMEGFRKIVSEGLRKVEYAHALFSSHGIPAWHHRNSLLLVFPSLAPRLRRKWSVPCAYGYSSITALPKLTYGMIEELCEDILKVRRGDEAGVEGQLVFEIDDTDPGVLGHLRAVPPPAEKEASADC